MTRTAWAFFSLIALLAAGGCPTDGPDGGGDSSDKAIAAEANGPADVAVGESVSLSASASDVDSTAVSYRWYQTLGRVVELEGAETASPTFVAPSVEFEQMLEFRVDLESTDGGSGSAQVAVRLAADPEYTRDPNAIGGGGGGGDDKEPFPRVNMLTSMGPIIVELDRENAPLTVSNFLRYAEDGFFDGTIFHRVIPEFVVQGGGFDPGLEEKTTRSPILNESDNGLQNVRGTIAMARQSDPDSATSQFFFNLVDNDHLDYQDGQPGYAVFGRVVDGLGVLDQIAEVETESRQGFQDVPVEDVVLQSVTVLDENTTTTSGGNTTNN